MARTLQTQRFCTSCQQNRLFTKETASNLIHAIITVFTCGLWAIVWIIAALLSYSRPYHCSQCGAASH